MARMSSSGPDQAPPLGAPVLVVPLEPDLDEFDLDLRLGELSTWGTAPGTWNPLDAQTDPARCVPTGGEGAEGGTCDTDDATCAGTCAGRGTCPVTECGHDLRGHLPQDLRGHLSQHLRLRDPASVPHGAGDPLPHLPMPRASVTGPPGVEPASGVPERLSVASEVAGRLADPAVLDAAVGASRRQTTLPLGIRWREHTIAQGQAGLAVLYAAMDAAQPARGWDRVGHAALARAGSAAERAGWIGGSLYTGLAGLGFAAVTLAAGRPRYDRFLTAVDRALLPVVAADIRRLDRQPGGCAVRQFDLISGLSGVGAYLLARRAVPEAAGTLRALLGCLVRLLDAGRSPPRWHTPADQLDQDQRAWYPDGNLNCGLAHGLPGPLALLAISLRAGVVVDGAWEAAKGAARWLAEHRLDDEWGPNWPNALPLAPAEGLRPPPARASWCYGSPGVARTLWLAGEALDDDGSRELAVAAMRAALARPPAGRGLSSPPSATAPPGCCGSPPASPRRPGCPTSPRPPPRSRPTCSGSSSQGPSSATATSSRMGSGSTSRGC